MGVSGAAGAFCVQKRSPGWGYRSSVSEPPLRGLGWRIASAVRCQPRRTAAGGGNQPLPATPAPPCGSTRSPTALSSCSATASTRMAAATPDRCGGRLPPRWARRWARFRSRRSWRHSPRSPPMPGCSPRHPSRWPPASTSWLRMISRPWRDGVSDSSRTRRGVDAAGRRTLDLLREAPGVNLVAVFAPEHGLRGDLDARITAGVDAESGLPFYSLYGATLRPTPAMLAGLDALVFDIQDVGCALLHLHHDDGVRHGSRRGAGHSLLRPGPAQSPRRRDCAGTTARSRSCAPSLAISRCRCATA